MVDVVMVSIKREDDEQTTEEDEPGYYESSAQHAPPPTQPVRSIMVDVVTVPIKREEDEPWYEPSALHNRQKQHNMYQHQLKLLPWMIILQPPTFC